MISIVIILYKSEQYIYNCITAIKKTDISNEISNIIIIDNDPKSNYVFNDKKINYYCMNSNIGYSKAMNFGIKKTNSDYVLALNPDTIITRNTIDVMLKTFEKYENVGAVGVKVLNSDTTNQLSSRRKFPHVHILISKIVSRFFSFIPNLYNYTNNNIDMIQEVDAVSGCCIMLDKTVFDELYGFDERFFMYFEDTDLCIRLNNCNKKVIYNPNTTIKHFKGGSLNDFEKSFINLKFYISMLRFIKKYYFRYVTFLTLFVFSLIIFIYLCQNIF